MSHKILIVEDDKAVRNLMTITLKANDYKYIAAKNGEEAIRQASTCNPDIILLDLGLPDMDGVEVIRKIRTWSNMPIIVISARSEDSDKIEALDNGADDYLTKPFSNEELLLRIKAVLHRIERNSVFSYTLGNDKINIGRFVFDAKNMLLILDGQEQTLTRKEAALLKVLYDNKNDLVTRKKVLKMIWGNNDYFIGRSMDVFIARLRKYLKADPNVKILTVHGVGFRLVVAEPVTVDN